MEQRVRDMTAGNPVRLILSFALPLMLGSIFQQLYTVVDTAVVGRYVGVEALAALGAIDWLSWLVLSLIQGLTQGFSILIAQRFGANDIPGLWKSVTMSVWLCAGIAILLSGVSQLALRPALRLIQTPDNIFADAAMYLHICYGGIVIIMAYNLLAAILRALGDGKTPLYAMVIAAVLNIGLDFLFVVGFHWGIAGAAVATVIAQCCSAGVCLRAVRRISLLQMDAESWKPDGAYLKKLLRLGMPLALQNIIISVGGLGVQSIINGFGYLFIAGFTAANKLYGLVELAAVSFGFAAATYVGQNLGARQYARIRRGVRVACLMAFCTSLVVSAVTLFFGHSLIGLFVSKTEPQYDMVLQTAYTYLTVLCVPLSVLYLLHVYRSALQGLGNMVIPLISGFAELFFRLLCAALLPLYLGETGIFYAEPAAWAGATVLLIVSYYLQIRTLGRTDAPRPLHDGSAG